MAKDNSFLGTQPMGKLLFKLAVPTVVAQLVNMLYNLVDRFFVGRIPEEGTLALTGLGVCMPLILVVSAFAALIASGGAPKASICMGRGETATAEKILNGCFILQLMISVSLTAVLLIWSRDLLLLFGASENTIPYAVDYMKIYALGTVFVQLTLGMGAFINAQGYATMGMVTVLIGAGCNVILDPIFIFAFDLGVRGAALATVLSQAASCIWVLLFLSSKKSQLRLRFSGLRFYPKLILPCVALGLSSFVMQSSESVISICFNSSLLKHGGDIAVGAMTILTSVMQFAMLPMQGIAQGSQPIISYNYGAKNTKRVKDTFRLLLCVCLGYSFFLWGFIMLFPRVFAGFFTQDVALIEFTVPAIRMFCAVLCIFGIQVACQMTFVSIGSAVCSITVAVMRKFLLLLPLIYLMPHWSTNATMGIYTAEPIADFIAVSFTAILFTITFKRSIRRIQPT